MISWKIPCWPGPFWRMGSVWCKGYVLLVYPARSPRSLYLPSGLEAESVGVRGQSLAGFLAWHKAWCAGKSMPQGMNIFLHSMRYKSSSEVDLEHPATKEEAVFHSWQIMIYLMSCNTFCCFCSAQLWPGLNIELQVGSSMGVSNYMFPCDYSNTYD